MLHNVRDAVIACLNAAGVSAGAAWPYSAVPARSAMTRVSILRAEDGSDGFGRYLGLRDDPESGPQEVYGMRCRLTLCLDVYAPLSGDDAAGACLEIFDAACAALCGGTVPGLQLRALRCGEPAPDRASGMMHLRGEAEGSALLVLQPAGDAPGTFHDFVLRGELNV